MKKLIIFLLCASLLASFAGCAANGGDSAETTAATTENEFEKYDIRAYGSLDELNAVLGTDIVRPDSMNPSSEQFNTMNIDGVLVAQCEFVIAEGSYIIRAAKSQAHISGYHYGDDLIEATVTDGTDVPPTVISEAGGVWARWFEGDVQYLMYTANGFEEIFNTLYEIEK